MPSPRRHLNIMDDLAPADANTGTPSATTVPAPSVPSSHEKWRQAEKTDDPAKEAKLAEKWTPEMLEQLRRRMRKRVPGHVMKEADAPSNLPDSKRAIVKMLESHDIWNTVKNCNTLEDMHGLMWGSAYIYSNMTTTLKEARERERDYVASTASQVAAVRRASSLLFRSVRRDVGNLSTFGTFMVALGFIRGMQFGRELDTKTLGNVDLLLKHAAIRKLLLSDPKATTLKICQALDKVEGLPWLKLRKEFGTWEACAKRQPVHQSVRTLISNARRVAIQDATFQEFLSVADGVGDEGSITNKFRPKKYAGLVKSKK